MIEQVKQQGAIAYLAHPYHIPLGNRWRNHPLHQFELSDLDRLHGIEGVNGENRSRANVRAMQLAHQRRLSTIAGSDAHFPLEIGNARTILEIEDNTLEAVKDALANGRTVPLDRRFNAYGFYLITGLLNKVRKQKYAYKHAS